MIECIASERIETNCYLIEEEGHALIIDPSCGKFIIDKLTEKGWEPDYIILTHEHYDHIWDLEEVRDHYGIPVIASSLCSERVQSIQTNLSSIGDILIYFKTGEEPSEPGKRFTCRAAEITFDETYTMNWRGHDFEFQRIPGHSPGSVLITMDQNSVFTGDYMIYGEPDMTRLKGGSKKDYDRITLPVLDAIPADFHVYPGHGPDYIKKNDTK